MGMTATSIMLFPLHRKLLPLVTRNCDPEVIDVMGNQRWHTLQVHCIDFERYSRQPNGIERKQAEIGAGPDNIMLVWTPRSQLLPTAIGNILADKNKYNASAKLRSQTRKTKKGC